MGTDIQIGPSGKTLLPLVSKLPPVSKPVTA
jgi:hypothetical protein